MSEQQTVFAMVDTEVTGPSIYDHSMVQLGVWAVDESGSYRGNFTVNIEHRENSVVDPDTQEWSDRNGCIFDKCAENAVSPDTAMDNFADWIRLMEQTCEITWVAMPTGFDWGWLTAYYTHYGPKDKPALTHSPTCMSTLRRHFRNVHGINKAAWTEMEKKWAKDVVHDAHDAQSDAEAQAAKFIGMMQTYAQV